MLVLEHGRTDTMTDRELLEAIKDIVGESIKPVTGKLDNIENRLGSVENRLDSVETRLDNVENRLDSIDTRLDKVEDAVTGVKLHLENATDKNILTVAEGHLDLSRKLDEALKIENEKEILKIRLNYLSDEMEQIKNRLTKLEQTA